MTAINASTASLPDLRRGLVSRLEAFRAQVSKHLLLEGATRWLAEAVAIALFSFILDRLFRFGLPVRMAILVLGVGFLVIEAWRWIVTPLQLDLNVVGLADAIDKAGGPDVAKTRGHLAARVASILQLPELLGTPTAPSPAMIRAAVLRCHDALDAVKFENHIDPKRRQISLSALVLLFLIPLALVIASPRSAGLWFRRYFLASSEPWPQRTYLLISGIDTHGKLLVPKAEPFVLRVTNREGSQPPETVTLRYREGRAPRTTVAMTKFGPGDYRYDFPPLSTLTEVEVTGNDDVQTFAIEPIERPKITELLLVSQHPTEEKPTPHNFAGEDADLSFLPKTKLQLTFTSNVPVSSMKLTTNLATPGQADVKRIDDRKFALSWTHEAPVQLQIELVGSGANLTSLPTPVAVGLKQDLPPRVSLTYSGVRQRVTPQARIPLVIQARDDYGITRLDLITKTQILSLDAATTAPTTGPSTQPSGETLTTTLVGPETPPTHLEIQYLHDLEVSQMRLPAGSILSVSTAAVDACYLGPQTGASRVVTFRIVPPEELFKEILLRQQAERVKYRKQLEDAQKVRDGLKALTTPDEALALARQHRQVQKESNRIANSLAESVTEMKLNALGGQEAWDLMDKNVLGPLKKLNDESMNQQKDALDSLNPTDAGAVSTASERQEKIITQMQEILRQMSQWDSFVDVVNQLNEIIRLETRVRQSTETMKRKQTEGIFD